MRKATSSVNRKAILIYSGGMDSTTLLYSLISEGYLVKALGVDYGQRHLKELDSARTVCEAQGIEFQIANLSSIRALFGQNALTNTSVEVPEEAYDVENMKVTVVPNRNMLMLAVAISWAIGSEFRTVAYAAHAGDRAVYPDCRNEFVEALGRAAELCDFKPIEILSPFIRMSKAEIVSIGSKLRVPFHLTWSCYKGEALHCGTCGTCHQRAEAFLISGVPDHTHYATPPKIEQHRRL